eukprot:Nitzschia sp. Nitz4//scaffold347_size17400//2178//4151//NITZ4_008833-RA/size17400-augustus-gene-0.33-mRNA-1//1//CDS//3329548660//3053//frame0
MSSSTITDASRRSSTSSSSQLPKRLQWPTSLSESRKRPRKVKIKPPSASKNLWVDEYTPSSSADLCVAPKKVKECKAWLENAPSNNLLVLVGSPGVGKSTMVRVVAQELGLHVHTWDESFVPRTASGGGPIDSVFSVAQSSPLDSFEEFLQHAGAGFASLSLVGNNGSTGAGAGTGAGTATITISASQSSETSAVASHTTMMTGSSILLLEELPHLHTPTAAERFRNILSRHFQHSRIPTILIFSDVSEGQHRPGDLERLVPPNFLYSPRTTICQINGVTKPKMKKVLEGIGKKRGLPVSSIPFDEIHLQSGGDIRHAVMMLQCGASVGVAATSTRAKGAGRASTPTTNPTSTTSTSSTQRDVHLSTFHSLGKVLYGKKEVLSDGHSELKFDPEGILLASDLGVHRSLRFVAYHSPDFFTEIEELGDTYELFSDASMLLERDGYSFRSKHSTGGNKLQECAASLAGRAVAFQNQHPAPRSFRPLTSPRIFELLNERRQNEILISDLGRRRLDSFISCETALTSCASGVFVSEILPVLRSLAPEAVNPTVERLYSMQEQQRQNDVHGNEKSTCRSVQSSTETREETERRKVQEEILQDDDIEEFE